MILTELNEWTFGGFVFLNYTLENSYLDLFS